MGGLNDVMLIDRKGIIVTAYRNTTIDSLPKPEKGYSYRAIPSNPPWCAGMNINEPYPTNESINIPEIIHPISRRQFFQGLALKQFISEDEALAAVQTGKLPKIFETLIDNFPENDRFSAKMFFAGASEFEFDHPVTQAIAASATWSKKDLSNLFKYCASL